MSLKLRVMQGKKGVALSADRLSGAGGGGALGA